MSKRQAKKKKKCWRKMVARALESQKTFSIVTSKHKSKYVYQEIAYYLLEEKYGDDETEKCRHFNEYCQKVSRAFDKAVSYLESENVIVYKHTNESGNRILYVTTDLESMPEAKQKDFDRLETHVRQTVKAAKTHVQLACPRLESQFNKSAQKLLTGNV